LSYSSDCTISPHQKKSKGPRTVAEALSAIENRYEAMTTHSRAEKRLLSALRTTCKWVSKMLKRPLACIPLDELVGVDKALIVYIERAGTGHQTAVQTICHKNKLLDHAHQFGWTCTEYELRKAWRPVRAAFRGNAKGYGSIIDFAIERNCPPGNFTKELMEAWKQDMLGRFRSLDTVVVEECHFRTTLRRAGWQPLFENINLASKNFPKYRISLEELPESLRKEILAVIYWKTVDEDLDDRDIELMIRPVTGQNLLKHLLQLAGYAIKVLGICGIVSLSQLLTKEIIFGYVEWLVKNGNCRSASITTKLSGIHHLTRTYPKLRDGDYGWFRAKLDTLRKEKHSHKQARKLNGLPDYPSIAEIVPKLLALRQAPNNLTELETGWLAHDALIYMINLLAPHRSRNTCETQVHPRRRLNIFETEITSELLAQLRKLPAWAKELREKNPGTKFLVCHWLEAETKANHEVWELFPHEAIPLFKEYVEYYRPLLLREHNPNSTSLFFTRSRKKLTQKSLLTLVARIGMRFTGKRMTVKHFRDMVAAQMLSTGATVDEVAERLWHLDPYSTTIRYYIGGFNTSDAVVALEDELVALAA
jgi:Phage integrase family